MMFVRTREQYSSKSMGAPQFSHAAWPTEPWHAQILSGAMPV